MPVIFYDNGILQALKANVNIVGAVNVVLTNSAFNAAHTVNTDITIGANTSAVRMTNPVLNLVSGNIQWSGDMVTFTASGATNCANAVWYADIAPRYLIAHYQLSNANTLALNDTFSILCNQVIANVYDPNN